MTHKERMRRHLAGEPVDRLPMIGGWSLGVRNLAALGGMSVEEYLRDPLNNVIRANRRQGVDGMVPPIVPVEMDSIRDGSLQEAGFTEVEPEALLARAEAIPATEEEVLRERFDAAAVEAQYRQYLEPLLAGMDDIALLPALWGVPATFALYFQYGYIPFLSAVALYPEAVGRIYWEDGVLSRAGNHLLAGLYREYDIVPMLLTGDDICTNAGPMTQPEFLHEQYWPHVKYALEPLLDAGIRLIHHCDGNVLPLLDDMVASGFTGFQGFQYECGLDIYDLRTRRGLHGEEMLILGGLSVTRTLPFATPAQVCREVDYCLDATDGGRGLLLFTSNVTGVEVPVENLEAAYRHLAAYDPKVGRTGAKVTVPPALSIGPG